MAKKPTEKVGTEVKLEEGTPSSTPTPEQRPSTQNEQREQMIRQMSEARKAFLSLDSEMKIERLYDSISQMASYISAIEQWRMQPFGRFDKDGNSIDNHDPNCPTHGAQNAKNDK